MTESEEQKLKAIKGWKDPLEVTAPPPTKILPTAVLDIEDETPEPDQVLVERRRREIDEIAKSDPDAIAAALANLMDEAMV